MKNIVMLMLGQRPFYDDNFLINFFYYFQNNINNNNNEKDMSILKKTNQK